MPSVEVVNLRDGRKAWYDLDPKEAVVTAYRQFDHHDYNWWDAPLYPTPVVEGQDTVACGDWCAKKEMG